MQWWKITSNRITLTKSNKKKFSLSNKRKKRQPVQSPQYWIWPFPSKANRKWKSTKFLGSWGKALMESSEWECKKSLGKKSPLKSMKKRGLMNPTRSKIWNAKSTCWHSFIILQSLSWWRPFRQAQRFTWFCNTEEPIRFTIIFCLSPNIVWTRIRLKNSCLSLLRPLNTFTAETSFIGTSRPKTYLSIGISNWNSSTLGSA